MSDLARSIRAANQRTEEVLADRDQLRARKEQLEGELAKCIRWLADAEIVGAKLEERLLDCDILLSEPSILTERRARIARAKNQAVLACAKERP